MIKEAMLLLGFDPEPPRGEIMGPMEIAGQMGGVGGTYVSEVEAVIRPFGIPTSVDRYAVVQVAAWGQARPAQLADALLLSPPGVSSLLDRLETHGLVTRNQGAVVGDGRGVMVRLTRKGSEAARAVATVFRRHERVVIDVLARTLDLAP
jgi:DNA-binding MarR family transcriptional regulator